VTLSQRPFDSLVLSPSKDELAQDRPKSGLALRSNSFLIIRHDQWLNG